jgi:transposase
VENVHDDSASETHLFTSEFKARTVDLVRTSGKSVAEVCRELDLTETAVRRWIGQAPTSMRVGATA